jgi:hypothetical protein
MGYLKEIKDFIKETEEEEFYINNDFSVYEKFYDFMGYMKDKYPCSYKKQWLFYSETDNGFSYVHRIFWIQNNEMKEFILEDEGY